MLRAFWKQKKRGLLVMLLFFCIGLMAIFGYIGDLENSKYRVLVPFAVWVLCPLTVVFEFVNFLKKGKK